MYITRVKFKTFTPYCCLAWASIGIKLVYSGAAGDVSSTGSGHWLALWSHAHTLTDPLWAEVMRQHAAVSGGKEGRESGAWAGKCLSKGDSLKKDRPKSLRRGKSSQFQPGLDESRWARRLNMHRVTGRSGGDNLIEMSPSDSYSGE